MREESFRWNRPAGEFFARIQVEKPASIQVKFPKWTGKPDEVINKELL